MNVRPSALLTTVRGAYGLLRCMQMIRPSFRDHLSFLSTWEVDKRQIEVCDTRAALVHRSGNILALHHETSASVRWPRLLRKIMPFLNLSRSLRQRLRGCQKHMAKRALMTIFVPTAWHRSDIVTPFSSRLFNTASVHAEEA